MHNPGRAILIHGTTAGPESFSAQEPLTSRFDLHRFSRRGYGERGDLAGPAGSNTELGWPVDIPDLLIEMERHGGAHLVGHSYGGPIAAGAAVQRPRLVRSLVLVETALGPIAARDPDMGPIMEREREVAARRLDMDAREFTAAWLATSMGAPVEHARAWIDTWDESFLAAADLTRREAWWGEAPIDLDVLAGLRVPKVVVIGARRPAFGPDRQAMTERIARATAERLGAELIVFPGSTHLPPAEEPEAFNELLSRVWST